MSIKIPPRLIEISGLKTVIAPIKPKKRAIPCVFVVFLLKIRMLRVK